MQKTLFGMLLTIPLMLFSAPNLTVEEQETMDFGTKGIVRIYAIKLDHPPKTPLFLVLESLVQSQKPMRVYLNEEGYVVDNKGVVITHVPLTTTPGEPQLVKITDKRGKVIAEQPFVPYPIETSTQDGYTLSFQHNGLPFNVFTVRGKGFKPFETVKYFSQSGNELIEEKSTANKDGELFTLLAPGVVGKKGGFFTVKLVGEKGSIELQAPWGVAYIDWVQKQKSHPSSLYVTQADVVKRLSQ